MNRQKDGMKTLTFLLHISFLIFLSACSTSIPLSETVIFTEKKTTTDNGNTKKDSLTWEATKGGSISFNTHAGKIQNYLDNEYEAHDYPNSNKFGIGFSSATNLGSYSMAYNIGYGTLGFNTTFGLG